MKIIVDASVACKWYMEESDSALAHGLAASENEFLAPDLIVAEVANVVWKRQRTGEVTQHQGKIMVDHLVKMFSELVPCATLWHEVLVIAQLLDHSVYDCFYVALASRKQAHLVTADKKLIGCLQGSRWSGLVIDLKKWQ